MSRRRRPLYKNALGLLFEGWEKLATIFSRHFLPLCLEFLVQLIQVHRKFSRQTRVHKSFPVPGAPGPPVPRGAHESAQATAPQLHPFLPIGLGLPRQPAAYNAYELRTAAKLISYLHATAGFARRYRHHLPGNKEDTSFGHTKMLKKNVRSMPPSQFHHLLLTFHVTSTLYLRLSISSLYI